MRDGVDDPADGQVVVSHLGDRVGVSGTDPGGVVVRHPEHVEVGEVTGLLALPEGLEPDVGAVLIRDAKVEDGVLVVVDGIEGGYVGVAVDLRQRHRERPGRLAFEDLGVLVVLRPRRDSARLLEEVVVLAEVLGRPAGGLHRVPEEAVALVGESVPALSRVAPVKRPELLFDVVIGVRLDQPVVAVGREGALVVEVVEQAEGVDARAWPLGVMVAPN